MALKEDLVEDVGAIFRGLWDKRDGTVIPEPDDLKLTNDAVKLDAVVLYADIDGSTALVDSQSPEFAAELYKAFLHCAAKVIRAEGGEVTAYDGDRIMGVFIEGAKNTHAARAGLKINHCVRKIINPLMEKQYANGYVLRHTVGVDASKLFVARTGIRGTNDLVWVGRAANYAAKLTELSADYPTRITGAVFDAMLNEIKVWDGRQVWERKSWTNMNDMTIYRSTWTWTP